MPLFVESTRRSGRNSQSQLGGYTYTRMNIVSRAHFPLQLSGLRVSIGDPSSRLIFTTAVSSAYNNLNESLEQTAPRRQSLAAAAAILVCFSQSLKSCEPPAINPKEAPSSILRGAAYLDSRSTGQESSRVKRCFGRDPFEVWSHKYVPRRWPIRDPPRYRSPTESCSVASLSAAVV